jgi:anti-sigma factor RsiW
MMLCHEFRTRIDFYLDNELSEEELRAFVMHERRCPECREQLAERRAFLEHLRSFQPLHSAPLGLRHQVESIIAAETAIGNSSKRALYRKIKRLLNREEAVGWSSSWWVGSVWALAAAVIVTVGIAFLWAAAQRQAKASAFVEMASETHQLQMKGHLPLEMASSSATEISNWLSNKVPFHLELPNYRGEAGETAQYTLVGARVVSFQGNKAAYVAYRMHDQLISLVIIRKSATVAWGGETTSSKGLMFHTHQRDGLQVITWSARNLTYALVSSATVSGRRSCVVCHATAKDRQLLQSYAPKRLLEHSF